MNLTELESRLEAVGILTRAYSFTSDGMGEVYRLAPGNDELGCRWDVYYSERGNQNNLRVFRSESEACEYFLNWIKSDPTTYQRPNQ